MLPTLLLPWFLKCLSCSRRGGFFPTQCHERNVACLYKVRHSEMAAKMSEKSNSTVTAKNEHSFFFFFCSPSMRMVLCQVAELDFKSFLQKKTFARNLCSFLELVKKLLSIKNAISFPPNIFGGNVSVSTNFFGQRFHRKKKRHAHIKPEQPIAQWFVHSAETQVRVLGLPRSGLVIEHGSSTSQVSALTAGIFWSVCVCVCWGNC